MWHTCEVRVRNNGSVNGKTPSTMTGTGVCVYLVLINHFVHQIVRCRDHYLIHNLQTYETNNDTIQEPKWNGKHTTRKHHVHTNYHTPSGSCNGQAHGFEQGTYAQGQDTKETLMHRHDGPLPSVCKHLLQKEDKQPHIVCFHISSGEQTKEWTTIPQTHTHTHTHTHIHTHTHTHTHTHEQEGLSWQEQGEEGEREGSRRGWPTTQKGSPWGCKQSVESNMRVKHAPTQTS